MRIHLLRHGDAADLAPNGPHTDEERPLTKAGIEKLERACEAYAELIGEPDRIVSSPLLRARESARILAAATQFGAEIEQNPILVPGGEPRDCLELLRTDPVESVVLVGHEPHLGFLLGLLLTGSEQQAIPLKKGMLVGVELESPRSLFARLLFALSQRAARGLA